MDRASDISIERLFWLRGVPSFAGGPRLWGLSKKMKWHTAGMRESGVSVEASSWISEIQKIA